MDKALKPEYLKRYKDIIRLLIKYGHTDIVQVAGLNDPEIMAELAQEPNDNSKTANPDDLVEDLQKLGPTYIKIGQFLSTRPDIIAPQ